MENKEKNITKAIENLKIEIGKLKNKTAQLMFFVIDSKGNPSGSLAYIYETAYQLHKMGYNVKMIHQEDEFVGVKEWLGEKYAKLPHVNSRKQKLNVSPADFLFIPEIYSNVMKDTMNLPCKKVAMFQNFEYLTQVILPGETWKSMNVRDCITTSDKMAERLKEIFPEVMTKVVHPVIDEVFTSNDDKRKIVINLATKNPYDVNSIVKPFYWKYPAYQWVSFKDLRRKSREEMAEALKEGIATVWVDEKSDFGYAPLESMAAGTLVIGKVPENVPEWMEDENGNIKDNGLWYYNTRDVHGLIGDVIQSYLHDEIPSEIYTAMKETASQYNLERTKNEIKEVYGGLLEQREKEFNILLTSMENNIEKEKTE